MNDKKHTVLYTYDISALRELRELNSLLGRHLNYDEPKTEVESDITDFTEANAVIAKIKSQL